MHLELPMARVNVFLSDDLLAAVDAEAKSSGVGRSALVQTALGRYLDDRRREREEVERRRDMELACRGIDALADKLGPWDPVKVIREFRENRNAAVREPRSAYRTKPKKGRS